MLGSRGVGWWEGARVPWRRVVGGCEGPVPETTGNHRNFHGKKEGVRVPPPLLLVPPLRLVLIAQLRRLLL